MPEPPDRDAADAFLPLHPRDLHILLAMADGPMHGYGIVKEIEGQSDGRLLLDPANLYRSLRRLEADRLVEEAEDAEPPVDDGRKRRFYRLTGLGRAVLEADVARMKTLGEQAGARLAAGDGSGR